MGGLPVPREAGRLHPVGHPPRSKEERVWLGNQDPPVELSRISVFDAATARVYVDRERRLEYLPYELDLLNKLGIACRTLGDRFRARMAVLNAAIDARLPQGYLEGTSVHAVLARLVPETNLPYLPGVEDLRLLGTWNAEKQAELERIEQQLSQEPREPRRPPLT